MGHHNTPEYRVHDYSVFQISVHSRWLWWKEKIHSTNSPIQYFIDPTTELYILGNMNIPGQYKYTPSKISIPRGNINTMYMYTYYYKLVLFILDFRVWSVFLSLPKYSCDTIMSLLVCTIYYFKLCPMVLWYYHISLTIPTFGICRINIRGKEVDKEDCEGERGPEKKEEKR